MKSSKTTKYVLASVYDKDNIAKLLSVVHEKKYQIIASEGTGKELKKHNIPYVSAETISGNPNKLKDCIKTISYNIEAGILYDRQNKKHLSDVASLGIKRIDMVVCNFPPIKQVVKKPNLDFHIGNVDVGGPLMVRAGATNFKNVLVMVDTNDYESIIKAFIDNNVTLELRKRMAIKAFRYINSYNQTIIKYLKNNKFIFS